MSAFFPDVMPKYAERVLMAARYVLTRFDSDWQNGIAYRASVTLLQEAPVAISRGLGGNKSRCTEAEYRSRIIFQWSRLRSWVWLVSIMFYFVAHKRETDATDSFEMI